MVAHSNTYCRLLPVQHCHTRSSLARSDTASIAITHSLLCESKFRPPRSTILRPPRDGTYLPRNMERAKIHRWRTLFVCERSVLARSDTASIAVAESQSQRSMLLRPPREDLIGNRMERFVKTSRWRTPSICARSTLARSDTANSIGAKLNTVLHGSSPPARKGIMGEVCPYI